MTDMHRMTLCRFAGWLVPVLLLATAGRVQAGFEAVLLTLEQSDFEFGRSDSKIPYPPLGFASYTRYDETAFEGTGDFQPGQFQQDEFSQFLMLPLHVGQRDMFVAGEYLSWTRFNFSEGPYEDRDLYTGGLIGGWLRQVSAKSQLGAFVAPLVSSALDDTDPRGVELYTGVLGLYRSSDAFTWLYGGVYEYSFGDHYLYPYVGFIWLPTPDWSVSLVLPWPSVTYALTDRLLLRAGFTPAGSQWTVEENGEEANLEFGSWNLMAGAEYRLSKAFWLYAGVGTAGFRGFQVSTEPDVDMDSSVGNDAVFNLSINFRPPGGASEFTPWKVRESSRP